MLDTLKDDPSRFVQNAVANHHNDDLTHNRSAALALLGRWTDDPSPQRRWIIRHALRNETKRGTAEAAEILSTY